MPRLSADQLRVAPGLLPLAIRNRPQEAHGGVVNLKYMRAQVPCPLTTRWAAARTRPARLAATYTLLCFAATRDTPPIASTVALEA
jgi:hypothetical protein